MFSLDQELEIKIKYCYGSLPGEYTTNATIVEIKEKDKQNEFSEERYVLELDTPFIIKDATGKDMEIKKQIMWKSELQNSLV